MEKLPQGVIDARPPLCKGMLVYDYPLRQWHEVGDAVDPRNPAHERSVYYGQAREQLRLPGEPGCPASNRVDTMEGAQCWDLLFGKEWALLTYRAGHWHTEGNLRVRLRTPLHIPFDKLCVRDVAAPGGYRYVNRQSVQDIMADPDWTEISDAAVDDIRRAIARARPPIDAFVEGSCKLPRSAKRLRADTPPELSAVRTRR